MVKLSKLFNPDITELDTEKKTISAKELAEDEETFCCTFTFEDDNLIPYFEKAMYSCVLKLDRVVEKLVVNGIRGGSGKVVRAYLKNPVEEEKSRRG